MVQNLDMVCGRWLCELLLSESGGTGVVLLLLLLRSLGLLKSVSVEEVEEIAFATEMSSAVFAYAPNVLLTRSRLFAEQSDGSHVALVDVVDYWR